MSPDSEEEREEGDGSKPDWWVRNERYRERFELPAYEPPTFRDGVYTHEVVEPLEAEYGGTIRFRGVNTAYPDDVDVRVDGESAFSVGRHRTSNGNTVYEIASEEFRDRVERYWTECRR